MSFCFCLYRSAERSRQTTEDYTQLVPNLMFDVKSKTGSLSKLRQKIQDFLALGTQVGVLVDPRSRTMKVYCPGVEKEVLRDENVLTVPELLPGWELLVAEVRAPEFD
jgi:Uma2 family endonuclease